MNKEKPTSKEAFDAFLGLIKALAIMGGIIGGIWLVGILGEAFSPVRIIIGIIIIAVCLDATVKDIKTPGWRL